MKIKMTLLLFATLLFAPFMMGQTAHKVTVKWTASTTASVTHYAVYRSDTTGGPYQYIGYTTGTSYINGKNPDGSALVEGKTYYYVVVAATATQGQFAVNSNEANATIPIKVVIAPATNVTAVAQ